MVLAIERVTRGSGDRWRRIRLQALQEAPHAFGTTFAEASRWPGQRWEQQVDTIATFVAVAGGSDVGVVRGVPHPSLAHVRGVISMWVAPAARRQHVGSTLIHAVTDWATSDGANTLVLDVAEDNVGAIAFYVRLGFEPFDGESMGERAPGELRLLKAISPIRT